MAARWRQAKLDLDSCAHQEDANLP